MTHVMIDLETMDTRPSAAIVSIGAVSFDREIGIKSTFYSVVDLKSSMRCGGTVGPDTVLWWMQQSDQAREALSLESQNLSAALQSFAQWLSDIENVEGVWGNPAAFDNVILRESYFRLDQNPPWDWRKDRCLRTLKKEMNLKPTEDYIFREFIGVEHNALDDAQHQAWTLIDIWNYSSRS